MLQEQPYFLTNEDWYYHDEKEWKYKLTELGKSIPEVVKSYNEFYAPHYDSEGNLVDY